LISGYSLVDKQTRLVQWSTDPAELLYTQ